MFFSRLLFFLFVIRYIFFSPFLFIILYSLIHFYLHYVISVYYSLIPFYLHYPFVFPILLLIITFTLHSLILSLLFPLFSLRPLPFDVFFPPTHSLFGYLIVLICENSLLNFLLFFFLFVRFLFLFTWVIVVPSLSHFPILPFIIFYLIIHTSYSPVYLIITFSFGYFGFILLFIRLLISSYLLFSSFSPLSFLSFLTKHNSVHSASHLRFLVSILPFCFNNDKKTLFLLPLSIPTSFYSLFPFTPTISSHYH